MKRGKVMKKKSAADLSTALKLSYSIIKQGALDVKVKKQIVAFLTKLFTLLL